MDAEKKLFNIFLIIFLNQKFFIFIFYIYIFIYLKFHDNYVYFRGFNQLAHSFKSAL